MKRIITCSDGTWNKIDSGNHTNVVKMYESICEAGRHAVTNRKISQLKAYDEGVGSGFSLSDKLLGGALGAGLDKNIKDMYTFISLNYECGDEIYLFGFSRGAYTARSIAGFIRNCGILKPENIHLVQPAYMLYRDRNEYSTPDSDMMKAWRKNYCFEDISRIKFVGVWDTVGSLGIPLPLYKFRNLHKYKFHDVKLSSTIEYAYHALAIDEKRKLFEPTLWEVSEKSKNDPSKWQTMEQRWFAGVHSNIGGGYADCGLSDIALNWLMEKAKEAGLCYFNPSKIPVKSDPANGKIVNSYTPLYWFWLPHNRTITNTNNQVIDQSVWERISKNPKYKPRSLSRSGFKPQTLNL